MTLAEANKVLDICATADGGCSVCVTDLLEKLAEAFPQFEWPVFDQDTYAVSDKVRRKR